MKLKIPFIVFICLFISCAFVCITPTFYSISADAKLTMAEKQNINDVYEVEPYPEEKQVPVINVEKLNWFTTVNQLFKKFSTARIIDCKTKKQYYVERVGGYNHADVETLTPSDTNTLKSLYGGTFSWERRAVWVEIDGIFIAGSINGMPHSYEYITDNNENGHTCIHFYMSRTHGTDNLDDAHQKAVSYAFEHGDEINDIIWQSQK